MKFKLAQHLKETLEREADRLGVELSDMDKVRSVIQLAMVYLATCVGTPGYVVSLLYDRNIVAQCAGIGLVDPADVELRGIILGGLATGARALRE